MKNILLSLIIVVLLLILCEFMYAGEKMPNIIKDSFLKTIIEQESKKEWKMLTDKSERVEPSYKKIFEVCSFDPGKNQKIDINLYSPEEWPSKNLGSYAFSPDGKRIAFSVRFFDSTSGKILDALYVLDAQDNKIDTILQPKPLPVITTLCWTADGKNIIFMGKMDKNEETPNKALQQFSSLYYLNLSTKQIDPLAQSNVLGINSQSCSSNGAGIVFTSVENEICVFNFETKSVRKIADGMWATWSPGGDSIAFFGKDNNYYTIKSDGTNKNLLIANAPLTKGVGRLSGESVGRILGELLWSPDGAYIYLERTAVKSILADSEYPAPYIMNIKSREQTRLPNDFCTGIKSWVGKT